LLGLFLPLKDPFSHSFYTDNNTLLFLNHFYQSLIKSSLLFELPPAKGWKLVNAEENKNSDSIESLFSYHC
jgi:hypothetical protein